MGSPVICRPGADQTACANWLGILPMPMGSLGSPEVRGGGVLVSTAAPAPAPDGAVLLAADPDGALLLAADPDGALLLAAVAAAPAPVGAVPLAVVPDGAAANDVPPGAAAPAPVGAVPLAVEPVGAAPHEVLPHEVLPQEELPQELLLQAPPHQLDMRMSVRVRSACRAVPALSKTVRCQSCMLSGLSVCRDVAGADDAVLGVCKTIGLVLVPADVG